MELVPATADELPDCIAAIRAVYRWELDPVHGVIFNKAPGWVAVPHEMGGELSEADAARIASVAAATSDSELWVAAESPGAADPEVYVVEASAVALKQARDSLSISDVVILPRSRRWFAILSEAEFGVLLGEPDLVAQLAGFAPSESAAEFRRYLSEWQHVPPVIQAVADAPWESYQSLADGAELRVRWAWTRRVE
jgi:hypothetical protein